MPSGALPSESPAVTSPSVHRTHTRLFRAMLRSPRTLPLARLTLVAASSLNMDAEASSPSALVADCRPPRRFTAPGAAAAIDRNSSAIPPALRVRRSTQRSALQRRTTTRSFLSTLVCNVRFVTCTPKTSPMCSAMAVDVRSIACNVWCDTTAAVLTCRPVSAAVHLSSSSRCAARFAALSSIARPVPLPPAAIAACCRWRSIT
mmetsp:Transcript_13609/g.42319  ORF Transcript_13609/g.42319 Transcript_13609/m.42319 type:complete len:204 (-) Transcript_13609:687-1298(-)